MTGMYPWHVGMQVGLWSFGDLLDQFQMYDLCMIKWYDSQTEHIKLSLKDPNCIQLHVGSRIYICKGGGGGGSRF